MSSQAHTDEHPSAFPNTDDKMHQQIYESAAPIAGSSSDNTNDAALDCSLSGWIVTQKKSQYRDTLDIHGFMKMFLDGWSALMFDRLNFTRNSNIKALYHCWLAIENRFSDNLSVVYGSDILIIRHPQKVDYLLPSLHYMGNVALPSEYRNLNTCSSDGPVEEFYFVKGPLCMVERCGVWDLATAELVGSAICRSTRSQDTLITSIWKEQTLRVHNLCLQTRFCLCVWTTDADSIQEPNQKLVSNQCL